MFRILLLAFFTLATQAHAVVIRHDVNDTEYRSHAAEFPALVDLPGEGHGVLIAPHWVITAAHAVTWQPRVDSVSIGGQDRAVARVVLHPGYRKLPQSIIDDALKTGSSVRAMKFLAASDDIALLQLEHAVTDVQPVELYRTGDQLGKVVRLFGKGATGTGTLGHDPHEPHRTELRSAFNQITSAQGPWLRYVFDAPPAALPLEGVGSNGDSGGPLLIESHGQWQLAGLSSWKEADGDPATYRPGIYGQTCVSVRLSHYLEWIERKIGSDVAPAKRPHLASP